MRFIFYVWHTTVTLLILSSYIRRSTCHKFCALIHIFHSDWIFYWKWSTLLKCILKTSSDFLKDIAVAKQILSTIIKTQDNYKIGISYRISSADYNLTEMCNKKTMWLMITSFYYIYVCHKIFWICITERQKDDIFKMNYMNHQSVKNKQ